MVWNYDQFGFDLNGRLECIFSSNHGAMFQGSVTFKVVSMNLSGAQSASSHGHMDSASCPP